MRSATRRGGPRHRAPVLVATRPPTVSGSPPASSSSTIDAPNGRSGALDVERAEHGRLGGARRAGVVEHLDQHRHAERVAEQDRLLALARRTSGRPGSGSRCREPLVPGQPDLGDEGVEVGDGGPHDLGQAAGRAHRRSSPAPGRGARPGSWSGSRRSTTASPSDALEATAAWMPGGATPTHMLACLVIGSPLCPPAGPAGRPWPPPAAAGRDRRRRASTGSPRGPAGARSPPPPPRRAGRLVEAGGRHAEPARLPGAPIAAARSCRAPGRRRAEGALDVRQHRGSPAL